MPYHGQLGVLVIASVSLNFQTNFHPFNKICCIFIQNFLVYLIYILVATLTYLLIGAAIFDKIESEEELNQSVALKGKH